MSDNRELSILIPVYNESCLDEVKRLKEQCDSIPMLTYEIVVGDDASTDKDATATNKAVEQWDNCRMIIADKNRGAAATRNMLVKASRYNSLIFLDCNMTIPDNFVSNYVGCRADRVVCGGVSIAECSDCSRHNLRYIYEKSVERRRARSSRDKRGYKEFLSGNFMAPREVMLRIPFNENMRRYEDVLLGRQLCENNIPVEHIDNPLVIDSFENNSDYISKVERSMRTLRCFSDELRGYSYMLEAAGRRSLMPLMAITRMCYIMFGKRMRRSLSGDKPRLWMFNLYRLGYFLNLDSSGNIR